MLGKTDKLERFIDAFKDGAGGCRRQCECGRVFYTEEDMALEPGEQAELESRDDTIPLAWTVQTITFENTTRVISCDCWHGTASMIMGFIDSHAHSIAKYINGEKLHKQEVAERAPVVKV